jgi:hypothetical protein
MPEHVDLAAVDIDELAQALQDQESYEHWWTFNPRTGEVGFGSRDLDDDEEDEEDSEREVLRIDPYPSWVWYGDMVDFAEGLSDERAARRLLRALDGRGAFRHFKNELYEEYPELVSVWHAFRTARAHRRAVEWLLDEDLIDEADADRFADEHPDPPIP